MLDGRPHVSPGGRQEQGGRARLLATVLAAGCVLALAPRPGRAWEVLRAPAAATDPTGPVLAAVTLLAWALAAWLLLGVALVLAGRLPGLAGRGATALAARTVPLAVRRGVGLALGAGLVLGAGTSAHAATAPDPASGVRAAGAGTSLDWPTTTAAPTTGPAPQAPPPASPAPAVVASPAPVTSPVPPAPSPQPATPRADQPRAERTGATPPHTAVVVRPGDTLWGLAERALHDRVGARPSAAAVAAAWPSWWAANREAVGTDPDLLLPGTALVAPQDS